MLSFLIEKEFKQLARNKIIPRMLVALPLMAMLVFPWAANLEIKNVRVDVVDNDHSPLSQRLVAEIGGRPISTSPAHRTPTLTRCARSIPTRRT